MKEEFQPKALPFFLSYYECVQDLDVADKVDFYELLIEYFFSLENTKERSHTAQALFKLSKHGIDKSLTKAKAGYKGGKTSTKKQQAKPNQTESKPQANNFEETTENTITPEEDPSTQREQIPYAIIMAKYNEICYKLPAIKSIDGERRKKTAAIYKKLGLEEMLKVFEMANESDFLCGLGNKGFIAKFDWLIKIDNANKVLEGNYKDSEGFGWQGNSSNGHNRSSQEERGFVGHAIEIFTEYQEETTQANEPFNYVEELPSNTQ